MKNDDFTGGPWTGFYLYVAGGPKHRMDMELTFKDGVVTGAGLDDVNSFTIRGSYEADSHAVTWTKSYPTHTVFYHGFREPVGIWGVWELSGTSGGFHIWPKGEGEGAHESAEEEAPVDAVIPSVRRAPSGGRSGDGREGTAGPRGRGGPRTPRA